MGGEASLEMPDEPKDRQRDKGLLHCSRARAVTAHQRFHALVAPALRHSVASHHGKQFRPINDHIIRDPKQRDLRPTTLLLDRGLEDGMVRRDWKAADT